MTETPQQDPWMEKRELHRKHSGFYELFGGFSLFALLGALGLILFTADRAGYRMNVYTELISVTLTILVLDRRAKYRADQERKEELIFLMGSEDNSTALSAVRMLRHKGWLMDGSLKGASLRGANLQGARLNEANLQGANLYYAKLQGANLYEANLQGANLYHAKLQGGILVDANLRGTLLNNANLEDALLLDANLQGASLIGANLENVQWEIEISEIKSTLPDGSQWTPKIDMRRFTDPDHPEFWEPKE